MLTQMDILLTNEVHTSLDNVIMIGHDLENAAHLLRLKRNFMVTKLCEVRIVTDLPHPLPGDSLDVILDEVLTTVELKKLESEEAIGSSESSGDIVAILDKKAGIKKATKQDKGSGESKNKKVFEENLKRAKSVHLPSVKKHIARMNAKTSDDLSRGESKGIYFPSVD